MSDVYLLSSSLATADQRGGSGDQVFDREHVELACFIVQPQSTRQRAPERAKQVDANRARFVDQLHQRLAVDGIRMQVVLEKRRGKRSRNRREVVHDEIDIVQDPLLDGSPVNAKLCVDCQTARQRTLKAMSEDCRHNLAGSARIIGGQQGREHAS